MAYPSLALPISSLQAGHLQERRDLINRLSNLDKGDRKQELRAFVKGLDIRVVQWELGFCTLSNRRLYCLIQVLSESAHMQVRAFPSS